MENESDADSINSQKPVSETDVSIPMAHSRISRIEEKRTRKQLIFVLLGITVIVIFVITIGLPLVVGASVFLGNIKSRGTTPDSVDTTAPFPPSLSPVTTATNSAQLKLEGYAEPESTLVVIVNGKEAKSKLLGPDGSFSFDDLILAPGTNSIYTTAKDAAGNESDPSSELTVVYKKDSPKLEVSEPPDGATFGHNQQDIIVKGTTDPGNQIHINERFVGVGDTGDFSFAVKLSEGENTLVIVATDQAGNETKLERKVTYQP